jgi:1-acyl-sn-glycerol-3-phosphate acyltransferase
MVRTCRTKVEQGFSLFLFPEGTRSPDATIQHFFRGAFYLANKYRIPVVPIVLEGTDRVLPKHSFSINPGPVLVRVLEPIHPEEMGFDERQLLERVRERMLSEQARLRAR